jgi:hypothetical protein
VPNLALKPEVTFCVQGVITDPCPVADTDGLYNASDFNDRLVLGLSGTVT